MLVNLDRRVHTHTRAHARTSQSLTHSDIMCVMLPLVFFSKETATRNARAVAASRPQSRGTKEI